MAIHNEFFRELPKKSIYFPDVDKDNASCYEFCPYAGNGCDMDYPEDCPKYMEYISRKAALSKGKFGQYYQDKKYYQ